MQEDQDRPVPASTFEPLLLYYTIHEQEQFAIRLIADKPFSIKARLEALLMILLKMQSVMSDFMRDSHCQFTKQIERALEEALASYVDGESEKYLPMLALAKFVAENVNEVLVGNTSLTELTVWEDLQTYVKEYLAKLDEIATKEPTLLGFEGQLDCH